jgi:hypothetical protein
MANDEDCRTIKQLEDKIISRLSTLKSEVDDLYQTVYKGNGTPSLVTQANELQGKLKGLKESVNSKLEAMSTENTLKFDSLHQKLENKFGKYEGYVSGKFAHLEGLLKLRIEDDRAERISSKQGVWAMRAALVTSVIAVITAIVTVMLN